MTVEELIFRRIDETGVNADDVCRGICSPSMFSKVKKGEKKFKPETLALILERLGMHNVFDSDLIMAKDYGYIQTIREARKARLGGKLQEAAELLEGIQNEYDRFSETTKQRFDMCETLLVERIGGLDAKGKLQCFEKIIRYTIKDYCPLALPKLLTNTEIMVLNVIANCYYYIGDLDTAIAILEHSKSYIENMFIDRTEAARRLIMICYNLSEFLGEEGKYDEAIAVAEDGIKWSKSIGSITSSTSGCMYNCALYMLKRSNKSEFQQIKYLAERAYQTSITFNQRPELINNISKLLKDIDNQSNHSSSNGSSLFIGLQTFSS